MWLLFYFIFFFGIKLIGSLLHTKKYFRCTPLSLKKKKKALKKNWQKNLNYLDTQLVVFHSQKTLRQFRFVVFFYFTPIISTIIFIFLIFFGFQPIYRVSCFVFRPPPPPHSVLLLLPLLLPGWSVNTPTVSPSFGQRCSCSVIGMRLPLISRRIFISRN